MKLTPLDIRKQEFGRSLRGLNPDEVSAFLQMLSTQWEELLSEQRNVEQQVRELEAKLQHYKNVEEALQEALRTARESSRQALDSAKQQALDIIREAERRSDEIKRSAEHERISLRKEASDARAKRNEIVARLRAFLHSEMELLSRFESDYVDQKEVSGVRGQSELSWGGTQSGDAFEQTPPTRTGIAVPYISETERYDVPRQPEHPALQGEPDDVSNDLLSEPAEWAQALSEDTEQDHPPRPIVPPAGQPQRLSPEQHGALKEEPRGGSGFVVHQVFGASAPQQPSAVPLEEEPADDHERENPEDYSISASADEIERIRRILKDLE